MSPALSSHLFDSEIQIEHDFAGRQCIGKRERQEDYYAFSWWTNPEFKRLALALGDGLGAHAGGNLASYFLINQFLKTLKETFGPIPTALRFSLEQANRKLGVLSNRFNEQNPPMGSTLVSFVIDGDRLYWISVGDSLLYLYRENELLRLNEDHSLTPLLEQRVRAGMLTAEEAARHPDRHVLQSACMGGDIYLIDNPLDPIELRPGDLVIAASDGILAMNEPEMIEVIQSHLEENTGGLADSLIFKVRELDIPRQDNTTLAIYRHGSSD